MDNVGDWLYIVFLIIAGVSGLFSSKDKKKAKSRPEILGQPDQEIAPNDQPTTEKGFWEILEDMQKEVQKPTPKPRPKKKKAKAKPQKEVVPSAQPSPFLATEATNFTHEISQPPLQVRPIEDEPGLMPEETFRDMGELRKAIICAEILNRKY